MLRRLERKLAEVQAWVDSVGFVADWPAAAALAISRTRLAGHDGLWASASRRVIPHVWIRPASLNGLRIRIDPRNLSEFVIYEEVFIEGIYDLGRVDFTPDAIVDCGAYEGYFTLLAHARFPGARVVAFEPNARNNEALHANLRANQLMLDVRAEAVTTIDGEASFSGSDCGGRLGERGPEAITVKTTDLRRVIADLGANRPLLKLDIEGQEAGLLPALIPVLSQQCAIFFEWHQGREAFQRISDLLGASGLVTSITRCNEFEGTTFIDAFAQRA